MRGLTMILVVYSHIVVLMLTPPHLLSNVNEIFILFRMPLFFFISGYFAYSATYDWQLFKRRSLNRLVKQLYPTMIIWFIFCSLFMDGSWNNWISDTFKGGYWFTFVSVEMFFTVIPLLWILSIYKTSAKTASVCLLLLCVIIEFIYLWIKNSELKTNLLSIMSLWQYFKYIPFFIFGMIAKIQREQFHRLCSNALCVLAVFIVFVLSIIYPKYSLLGLISAVSGIFVIYSIFYFFENLNKSSVSKTFRIMAVLGSSTLEIYLLHYFFIYIFRETLNLNILASLSGSIMEFPVYFAFSVFICILCLCAVELFKKMHIYNMLFPSLTFKRFEIKAK